MRINVFLRSAGEGVEVVASGTSYAASIKA